MSLYDDLGSAAASGRFRGRGMSLLAARFLASSLWIHRDASEHA